MPGGTLEYLKWKRIHAAFDHRLPWPGPANVPWACRCSHSEILLLLSPLIANGQNDFLPVRSAQPSSRSLKTLKAMHGKAVATCEWSAPCVRLEPGRQIGFYKCATTPHIRSHIGLCGCKFINQTAKVQGLNDFIPLLVSFNPKSCFAKPIDRWFIKYSCKLFNIFSMCL